MSSNIKVGKVSFTFGAIITLLISLSVAISVGSVPVHLSTVWSVILNKLSPEIVKQTWSKGREAIIIDPVIENVAGYVNLLKSLNLKLVKVIDTHIHADHVTGASKLKDITKCSTIMGEHTPAETVEIKVKDDEYINLDHL